MQDLECSTGNKDSVSLECRFICTHDEEECCLSPLHSPRSTIRTVMHPSLTVRHSSCVHTAPCAMRSMASNMDAADCLRLCMTLDSVPLLGRQNRFRAYYTNLARFVKERTCSI
jgi:hypothetical protein